MGRIVLCFASFACAVMVMKDTDSDALWGVLGVVLLILTSLTDYFDGLVARKLDVISRIGPLADQMMDKMVYCIIFPTLSVGLMQKDGQDHIFHVMLSLALCVTLLVRDHWVNFLRSVADRHQADSGVKQIGKIRTLFALPLSCVMYAYCFSRGEYHDLAYLNSIFIWVQEPFFFNILVLLEVVLFLINIVSVISYTKLYGGHLLDDICEGDVLMRRRILGIFPNLLTLMNAAMGVSAIALAQNGRFHLSMVLLVFAAVFDKLDGAAARKLGLIEAPTPGVRKITLGMILDDVADLISFCIAPAAIGGAYLPGDAGFWVLVLYSALGIARLVYFTLDTRPSPGFFKGLPSPAAALFVVAVIHFAEVLDPEALYAGPVVAGLFLLTGLLMNAYPIKFIHFGQFLDKSKRMKRAVSVVILVSIFLTQWLGIITITIMLAYLSSPFYLSPPSQRHSPA